MVDMPSDKELLDWLGSQSAPTQRWYCGFGDILTIVVAITPTSDVLGKNFPTIRQAIADAMRREEENHE